MSEMWPPDGAEPLVAFRVVGMPRPAGSKNVIPLGRRDPQTRRFKAYTRADGSPIFNVQDSSGQAGENWRADVRAAAATALDAAQELADGPLVVEAVFYVERPRSHYGTGRNAGRLKPGAPSYPQASRLADGTKLMRALEDALNKVVWLDDRCIVESRWARRYGQPGAEVRIWTLPNALAAEQAELLVEAAM